MQKIIIIGAGLSGLYAAYLLQNKYDITLLEARDRLGGRILTQEGHDLGPSWVWPHHSRMLALLRSLDLELFSQYTQGSALFEAPGNVERFMPPPASPSARLKGGLCTLIDALKKALHRVDIHTDEAAEALYESADAIEVTSSKCSYFADRVIVAMPPRIALKMSFEPRLAEGVTQMLQAVPTWMGHSRKCVIVYDKAFWREQGLSGFAFSHVGPIGELHDACTLTQPALFGFINNRYDKEEIQDDVIRQLVRLFGTQAQSPKAFYEHNWREDPLSSVNQDRLLKSHPKYGYEITAYKDRLHFISSEASFEEGGYLEGALNAGSTLAKKLWYCST